VRVVNTGGDRPRKTRQHAAAGRSQENLVRGSQGVSVASGRFEAWIDVTVAGLEARAASSKKTTAHKRR
jgi:hypothetical protein